jgi:DNA-binding NtrC family response regulator
MIAERRRMDRGVMVLLVGNGVRNASTLEGHLLKRGCSIFFATSKKEAIELLQRRRFDVVLSEFMLRDGTAYELMSPFLGTGTSMFFSNAVEDGCWWMTAVFEGQDRSEEPGMRPIEFRGRLDEIISDKLSRNTNRPANKPFHGVTSHAES